MASITISELNPTGTDLFSDSESFISDLTDHDFSSVMGGYFDTIDGDWCGTTKVTRTITSFPTRSIGNSILLDRSDLVVVNQVLPV